MSRNVKALVIDDSLTIRKLVELSVRALPMSVEYAQTGADGLERARNNPPDIIFLDFLLPDMRGLDVCQSLARDPRTANSAVVLITGKDQGVRDQFRGLTQVVGYLRKPFNAAQLVSELNAAMARAARSTEKVRPTSNLSPERREAIAQAMYARFKPHLNFIPEWMAQLGDARPASFFARRLLSPEVLDELVAAIVPLLGISTPAPMGGLFEGQLAGFPLLDVLRTLVSSQRSGVLQLQSKSSTDRAWIWLRRGNVVMVTTDTPPSIDELSTAAGRATDAQRDRAIEEQRKSGKPMFVSLAEAGLIPSWPLTALLHEAGTRALSSLVDERGLSFSWSEPASLPLFVEAHAREISLDQLRLEQLRRAPQGEVEPTARFERVPGFSKRVRQFSLTSEERAVLALIDGHHSQGRVSRRAHLSEREVGAIVSRLVGVGLLRRGDRKKAARKIVVVDTGEISQPLEQLVTRRNLGIELVRLQPDRPDLIATLKREGACLVLVCISQLAQGTIEALASMSETASRIQTVAVLDSRERQAASDAIVSGFDHVLLKPVWFGDLERILEDVNGQHIDR